MGGVRVEYGGSKNSPEPEPVPGSRNEKRAVPVRFLKYNVEPETDPLKYQMDTNFFEKI